MSILIEPQLGQELNLSRASNVVNSLLHILAFLSLMCQLIRALRQLTLELQLGSCIQILHEYFSENFLEIAFILFFFLLAHTLVSQRVKISGH